MEKTLQDILSMPVTPCLILITQSNKPAEDKKSLTTNVHVRLESAVFNIKIAHNIVHVIRNIA